MILLLESKQEMLTWALAIDGMRMIRVNDGSADSPAQRTRCSAHMLTRSPIRWAVDSCWDAATKNQLLQWRFKVRLLFRSRRVGTPLCNSRF